MFGVFFCSGLSISGYQILVLLCGLFLPTESSVHGSSICLNAEMLLPEKGGERNTKTQAQIINYFCFFNESIYSGCVAHQVQHKTSASLKALTCTPDITGAESPRG